ncbi:hypothetical protein FS749_013810 [Ceratobasidium sp. UAMH 11750]|nr:hypothetical protein FS749_013810 [Ceratobasidium sp. UAMH 11750]
MHFPALGTIVITVAGVVLAAPTSPGECKQLASLSFAHTPNVTSGLSTHVVYNGLTRPRGIRFDALENLLIIDRGVGIVALSYRNDTTCAGWERRVVVNNANLNHGIEVGPGTGGGNQYLYASSSDNVFRWEYSPGNVAVVGNPTTIAFNMSNADHTTRTLLLQPQSGNASQYIIVSRGSESNQDEEAGNLASGRSQIRRFALNSSLPTTGWGWNQGELLGWGLRNAVGIALSRDGHDLWEVENSVDDIRWQNVDVHQDNPAEELNLIRLNNTSTTPDAQKYYGYPTCYTAWDSSSLTTSSPPFTFQTGEQFSIRTPGPGVQDDTWCNNEANNIKPRLSMQAHSAPLDIVFYRAPSNTSEGWDTAKRYAVNTQWDGDAFVSFHGSWNRDPPTGYKVVRIPWSGSAPVAPANSQTGYETILGAPDVSKCPGGCVRPVGLAFDRLGRLFVSSDTTGEVFMVENASAPDAIQSTPSAATCLQTSGIVFAGIITMVLVMLI